MEDSGWCGDAVCLLGQILKSTALCTWGQCQWNNSITVYHWFTSKTYQIFIFLIFSSIQGDSEEACKNETGHRGCSTDHFEVGILGSMKLA